MKLALQIYTLRTALSPEEMPETLKKVKAMGYDGVEWYGFLGMTPAELKKLTNDAGLEFFSLHINQQIIDDCDTELMDAIAASGIKYLPIGSLPADRMPGGERFADTVTAVEKYCSEAKKRGLYVLYHNHDFDLAAAENSTKLDKLLERVDSDLLGAELDTCWLYSGGVDAAEYIRKYTERAPVIHVKDCVKEGGRSGYMPVGYGVLDWDGILAVCGDADWICVEQDAPCEGRTAFECAELSAKFLRERLG